MNILKTSDTISSYFVPYNEERQLKHIPIDILAFLKRVKVSSHWITINFSYVLSFQLLLFLIYFSIVSFLNLNPPGIVN